MRWLIEDTKEPVIGEHNHPVDTNGLQLLEAVKARQLPWTAVGFIPFVHQITGIEEVDTSSPAMFYGSVQGAAAVARDGILKPGVFWSDDWWDPRNWIGKRSDLLNSEIVTTTARELREHWVTEPLFCKSVAVKGMTGDVLEVDKKDKDDWVIEFSHLDGDAELLLSRPQRIKGEWRFFVVNGEVVTGSTYRFEGLKRRMVPVPEDVWAYAHKAVKEWMPSQNIVIDLALTDGGEMKVVEFNAINSSGFYNSNVGAVVDAIERWYGGTR